MPPTATMVSVLTANVVTACIECTLYGIFLVLALVAFSLWVRRHASDSPRPRWRTLIWDLRRSPLIMVNLFFVVTITAVRLSTLFDRNRLGLQMLRTSALGSRHS